jgi:hypothetical protein
MQRKDDFEPGWVTMSSEDRVASPLMWGKLAVKIYRTETRYKKYSPYVRYILSNKNLIQFHDQILSKDRQWSTL